jgi:hypothetical protein
MTSGAKLIKKPKTSNQDDRNTIGTIWENRLSKEDYQVLDKAFEDCEQDSQHDKEGLFSEN